MGRRKERRIAAMSNAGRRVKLDLFAEPSGDLGGSSTQEEVGGDGDSKSHAQFPDSPSSSGKQPQNPLLLLEQYSDEELDGDSNEVQNDATAEDASIGKDEQSKAAAAKKAGSAETDNEIDSIGEVEELLMDNTSADSQSPSDKPQKESMGEIDSYDMQKQTNKMKESTNSDAQPALNEHLIGDVSSGWKMVLHEESNQYYYWNVTTGETSWEVPDVLVQQTVEMSAEEIIRDTAGKTDALMGTYQSSTPLGTTEDDFATRELSVKVNSETSGSVDSGTKKDRCRSDTIKVKEGDTEVNQDNGTSLLGRHSIESNSAADLSLQLIKHCESLLERLNSVKGLNCYLEGHDLKSKCSLEIEIRLADIKALSSYESPLLPFWLHSEAQLKRLEATIDGLIQQVNPVSKGGFEAALELPEGTGDDIEIGSRETKELLSTLKSHVGETTEKSILEAHDDGPTTESYSGAHPGNDLSKKSEITVTGNGSELNPGPALHSVDDVDMDVDMEVEDTSSIMSPHAGASGAHYHVSVEPLDVQCMVSNQEPKVPGQVSVPSDEEWIPPPPPDDEPFPPLPPDDEPFPPLPPDDPPATSYPMSNVSSVQVIPYSGEYTLSYPGPGLEYYVQTEVPGSTLYTHAEGGQVALSHVPHYYEAGPNMYPLAPAIINPVEPTSYYGLQNGTVNPVPLMHSTTESSGAKGEPASEETGAAGSLDSRPEAGSDLLLKKNFNIDKSFHGTALAPPEVPEARHSPATSSMANVDPASSTSGATASVSSAAAAAAAATAAALKPQPKVSRTKKRTVAVVSTLRSNKKVSSLVDKWNAAKEELHEEVEEPEDAYELLEKKRKREIEQWRAKQIASGEAKDNANFQPLGGDWRERVKRKRAEKMKETRQSSPEVSADGNQQPDLIQLSKSLPSGWQAYWDDSSKKIYYGNLLTSATTWTKPTD
ncbi:hypothetical protein C2S51_009942 [Perilla frutescens var. frutescens]|nr:hypothetical protein C2S51_009942 [Perilla frutescens var. frutescens]